MHLGKNHPQQCNRISNKYTAFCLYFSIYSGFIHEWLSDFIFIKIALKFYWMSFSSVSYALWRCCLVCGSFNFCDVSVWQRQHNVQFVEVLLGKRSVSEVSVYRKGKQIWVWLCLIFYHNTSWITRSTNKRWKSSDHRCPSCIQPAIRIRKVTFLPR